jgi:hypothetical protein
MFTIIRIKKVDYVHSDEVFEYAPIYCKGSRSSRELIKKKEINDNNYIFARLSKTTEGKWVTSDGSSSKMDKTMFKHEFVINIKEIKKKMNTSDSDSDIDDGEISEAPDIIELEDNEKFRDSEGNVLEIETRGDDRKSDQVYFKVEDVSEYFNMKSLHKSLLEKTTSYKIGIDFKYFLCKKDKNLENKTSKKIKVIKKMFLTYEGMLRVLFVSRNDKTKPFIKWATETLFTVQMGTQNQKQKLSSKLLGTNAEVIKEVFNTHASTVPCVYLFTLGLVKDLRKSMKICDSYDDTSIVCKYGRTDSIKRRTSEHMKTYGKIKHTDLKLKHYSYIDLQYMAEAESDIKQFVNDMDLSFKYENQEELLILPQKLMTQIKNQYELISKKYIGHNTELVAKIKNLENEVEILNHKITFEQQNVQMEQKNNEILQLKLFIAESKLK